MPCLQTRHLRPLCEVQSEEIKQEIEAEELPDNWWYRVYAAVIMTTIVVISVLGVFTRYFR